MPEPRAKLKGDHNRGAAVVTTQQREGSNARENEFVPPRPVQSINRESEKEHETNGQDRKTAVMTFLLTAILSMGLASALVASSSKTRKISIKKKLKRLRVDASVTTVALHFLLICPYLQSTKSNAKSQNEVKTLPRKERNQTSSRFCKTSWLLKLNCSRRKMKKTFLTVSTRPKSRR